jgi:hypothetical protein
MKRINSKITKGKMSPDAYAGFLKLWITPAGTLPERTPEIDAYLRHVSEVAPLEYSVGNVTHTDRAA